MHQTTALRRASTVVVAALFAVVFVCSGVGGSQTPISQGETAVSAHTGVSKAAVRTVQHASKTHHAQADSQFDLASTGPAGADSAATSVIVAVDNEPAAWSGLTTSFTSDRAPPAL
jgi:hypothetical protein